MKLSIRFSKGKGMKITLLSIKTLCLMVLLSILAFPASQTPLLTDASATYSYKNQTFKCGLYEGTNDMPAEHLQDGMEIANSMRSMSKINVTVIGHSVPQTTFQGWSWSSSVKSKYGLAANTNFANGAIAAVMAWDWIKSRINGTSTTAIGGFAPADIHILVVQLTWAPFMGPDSYEMNTPLQTKMDSMAHDFGRLAANAKKQFPNLKMILFEADPWQNNHEPYHAYHEWFFCRQVVMNQIKAADPNLAYKGSSAKSVWIDLGGYWWMPNASSSYYTDCCHISGTGASYYQDVWLKALLKNPVLNAALSANVNVHNSFKLVSPDEAAINCMNLDQGIKVAFSLFRPSKVSMGLFSTNGQAIVPMSENSYASGNNSVVLKTAQPLNPGSYIVRFNSGTVTKSQKMTITQ
jgi:hypothetical protein